MEEGIGLGADDAIAHRIERQLDRLPIVAPRGRYLDPAAFASQPHERRGGPVGDAELVLAFAIGDVVAATLRAFRELFEELEQHVSSRSASLARIGKDVSRFP